MDKNNYGVIMAGGIGSRFWPMSVPSRPKQFLDVLGIGKTLIQLTFERLANLVPEENILILTNDEYVDLVKQQLPGINDDQILTEPERKNTAPCITYAAAKIYAKSPDATMIVAPSDHLILKESKFVNTLQKAIKSANEGEHLVTLGIKPSRPDTGYGYIEFKEDSKVAANAVYPVKQFREKPNKEMAELFIRSGNYYWNSGIFIWRASVILDALKEFNPALHGLFTNDMSAYFSSNEKTYIDRCFRECEDISIDFSVMEKTKNAMVVLADFDWSDLGTWSSLYTHLEKDYNGNAVIGDNVYMINSSDCIVNIPNDKIALIEGLSNHIVVESDNRLMILNKADEQNIKKYMSPMKEGSEEFFK